MHGCDSEIITDWSRHEMICSACGLVLPEMFVESNVKIEKDWSERREQMSEFVLREEIQELSHTLFLFSPCTHENIFNYYMKIKQKHEELTSKKELCHLLAYCIWETCKKYEHAIFLHEIAYVCNIEESNILKLSNKFKLPNSYALPSTYVARICSMFQIPFFLEKAVLEIIREKESNNFFNVESLIGACIYVVYTQLLTSKKISIADAISLKQIASTLQITSRTIRYFARKQFHQINIAHYI